MNIKNTIAAIVAVLTLGTGDIAAQEFNAIYTSELQSDFKDKNNFVNLLRLDFSMPVANGLSVKTSTMSYAESNAGCSFGDLQGLSNIDSDNFTLTPAVLGLTWQTGKSEIFVGIHNMDEYLFASPSSSLFLNATCGFYPTLSLNYPVATYPLAAVGAAYTLHLDEWTFHTSIYNGVASNEFSGAGNVFRFCPQSDGILSTTQVGYEKNGNNYNVGMAHYNGLHTHDTEGEHFVGGKSYQSVYWAYAEQKIDERFSVLVQFSLNPSGGASCRSHVALGGVVCLGKTEGGLYADYLDASPAHEWLAELTWKFPILKKAYVQPALSYFNNNNTEDVVGLVRFGIEL